MPNVDFTTPIHIDDFIPKDFKTSSTKHHDAFYRWSYPVVLRQFDSVKLTPSQEAFQNCLVALSAWMGRRRFDEKNPELVDLEQLSRSNDEDAIKLVRHYGSTKVVSASKFLHFLKPCTWAMLDTRVASAIEHPKYHSWKDDFDFYLTYVQWIGRSTISCSLLKRERSNAGSGASDLRVKEFILFQMGRQDLKGR